MSFQEHYPAWRQALAGGGWRGSGEELPAAAAAWLLHQGSLTEKLRGRCGSLKVRIVRQGWFSGSLKTNEASFCAAKTNEASFCAAKTNEASFCAAKTNEASFCAAKTNEASFCEAKTNEASFCEAKTDTAGLPGLETAKAGGVAAAASERVWLREVMLFGDGVPWVFAQTLLPESGARGAAAGLTELGDEPIGPWLFARRTRRQSLQWRRDEGGLYARRSMLLLEGSPLQISELFLPQFDFAG